MLRSNSCRGEYDYVLDARSNLLSFSAHGDASPPERIAYVSLLNVGKNGKRDAIGVIDVNPRSSHMASSSAR